MRRFVHLPIRLLANDDGHNIENRTLHVAPQPMGRIVDERRFAVERFDGAWHGVAQPQNASFQDLLCSACLPSRNMRKTGQSAGPLWMHPNGPRTMSTGAISTNAPLIRSHKGVNRIGCRRPG